MSNEAMPSGVPTKNSTGVVVAAVLAVCAVFTTINLLTGSRWPVVWCDETFFADPAASLVQGHGFTTTLQGRGQVEPFYINVPGYSLLLSGWMRIFGIAQMSVRLLPYLLLDGSLL